jgi:protein-L-isoaspartate(D-aspartate) O-methyltransferase
MNGWRLAVVRAMWPIIIVPVAVVLAEITADRVRAENDPFAAARERMVREQIENRGVRNADVLRVMRQTPRHLFVPQSVRSLAYDDGPLPIGWGATISQPYIVAFMTEMLKPAKHDRVLEIGTGSGYQAAVLAQLTSKVYSVELVPELAAAARDRLRKLGYSNVTVRQGDGYQGWREEAPFDRILLTAAPEEVPEALIEQLADRGRLVAPVGSVWSQELVVIEKSNGSIRRWSAGGVQFIPMKRE